MNGWEKYLESRVKVWHFVEFGVPEWWVKLRSSSSMLYGFTVTVNDDQLLGGEGLKEESRILRLNEALLKQGIVAWNIPDPEKPVNEDGSPNILPIPSVDPTVLHKLPTEFIFKIVEWMGKDSTVPPQSDSPSSA